MKVYTRVVINMNTMQTVEEESFEHDGVVAWCGGSGGGNGGGEMDWPGYMKTAHETMIGNTVSAVTSASSATQDSPYAAATLYDPAADMDEVYSKYSNFDMAVQMLSEMSDWDSMTSYALTKLNDTIFGDAETDDAVEAFTDRQQAAYTESVTRLSAGFADINAVGSSQYTLALAKLEDGYNRIIADYNAQLSLNNYKDKITFVTDAVKHMTRMLAMRVEALQSSAGLAAEIKRQRIVAENDYLRDDLHMSVRDRLWDLELYKYTGNALASISGGMNTSAIAPDVNSKIGGALAGASLGMTAGGAISGALGAGGGAAATAATAGSGVGMSMMGLGAGAGMGGMGALAAAPMTVGGASVAGGAASGAAAGSVVPGLGTIIGALVGGGIGLGLA